MTLAHLNGDGIKDLIVANSGSNDVLVFLGDKSSDGGFGNDPNSLSRKISLLRGGLRDRLVISP